MEPQFAQRRHTCHWVTDLLTSNKLCKYYTTEQCRSLRWTTSCGRIDSAGATMLSLVWAEDLHGHGVAPITIICPRGELGRQLM